MAHKHLDHVHENMLDRLPVHASRKLANGGGHSLKKVAKPAD